MSKWGKVQDMVAEKDTENELRKTSQLLRSKKYQIKNYVLRY